MKQLLNLTAFLIVLSAGCEKASNEEKMPEQTQSGANIVACKVNGKVHIYSGKPNAVKGDGVSYFRELTGADSIIQIIADNTLKYNDEIFLSVYTFHIEIGKEYTISSEFNRNLAVYSWSDPNAPYTTTLNSGHISFKRCDEGVASGNFSFTATNKNGEKVEITEGSFDITRTTK